MPRKTNQRRDAADSLLSPAKCIVALFNSVYMDLPVVMSGVKKGASLKWSDPRSAMP